MSEKSKLVIVEQGQRYWIAIQNEKAGSGCERLIEVASRDAVAMTDSGVPLLFQGAAPGLRVVSAGDPDMPAMFDVFEGARRPGEFQVQFAGLGVLGAIDPETAQRVALLPEVRFPDGLPEDWTEARMAAADRLEAEARALREQADALEAKALGLRGPHTGSAPGV